MHKNHFLGCIALVIVALTVLTFGGGSVGSLGILAVALLCPLVMVGGMWLIASRSGDHGRAVPRRDGDGFLAADPADR